MSIIKKSFLIFLIINIFTQINTEDRRASFAASMDKFLRSYTLPSGSSNYVKEYDTRATVLFYTLSLSELDKMRVRFSLSSNLIEQIKMAPFAKVSTSIKIEESKSDTFYLHKETLGAAIKEDDGRISFALIEIRNNAKLLPKYDNVIEKECKRILFWEKCKNVTVEVERDFTESEKIIINSAAKYYAGQAMKKYIGILKQGDYELYMSDGNGIVSPDGLSIAYVTSFGNIAIGPKSEVNSLQPIEYRYKYDKAAGKYLKTPTGSYRIEYFYPINTEEPLGDKYYTKSGKFHKFNFIKKDISLGLFPTQIKSYIESKEEAGPYVLEIKKTGDVKLYSQKSNLVLWSTNTANKGVGPFNLYLTNNKILRLEDSTGKLLYSSSAYEEVPTVFYTFKPDIRTSTYVKVYNGQTVNQNRIYDLSIETININSDIEDKFTINYRIRTDKKIWLSGTNKNQVAANSINKIVAFSAIIYDTSFKYDICYSGYLLGRGWTGIACNDNPVGATNIKDGTRLVNIIIYFKNKYATIPKISNLPPLDGYDDIPSFRPAN